MATILIVDDDAGLRDGLAETISDLGHRALLAASGHEALEAIEKQDVDGVFLDLRMPGLDGIETLRQIRKRSDPPPVVVLTAFASAENTIEAMRLGAFDHLTKPIGRNEIKDLLSRLPPRRRVITRTVALAAAGTLIGASDGIRQVQKTIGLASDSDATVLVLGETGTGKELVARALHVHSKRKSKPFVAVNCSAIPAELLESELFGHVKGSFTGATADRPGAFRQADGGTLFLDEIGDMSPTMQAKILRALQERTITPVGGKPVAVDARIVAATHRDLPALVAKGSFREDLYYRLNVIPIILPPLRERHSDITALAEHFLGLISETGVPKRLTSAATAKLMQSDWPGNVRQLRNVIDRAYVLARGSNIDASDLDISNAAIEQPLDLADADMPTAIARLEEAMIRKALDACNGNRAEAARRLNIHRQLLYTKMQRYGLGTTDASANPTRAVGNADDD